MRPIGALWGVVGMIDEVNEFLKGGAFQVFGVVEIQDSNVNRGEFIVVDIIVLFGEDLDDVLFGLGSICSARFQKCEVNWLSKTRKNIKQLADERQYWNSERSG